MNDRTTNLILSEIAAQITDMRSGWVHRVVRYCDQLSGLDLIEVSVERESPKRGSSIETLELLIRNPITKTIDHAIFGNGFGSESIKVMQSEAVATIQTLIRFNAAQDEQRAPADQIGSVVEIDTGERRDDSSGPVKQRRKKYRSKVDGEQELKDWWNRHVTIGGRTTPVDPKECAKISGCSARTVSALDFYKSTVAPFNRSNRTIAANDRSAEFVFTDDVIESEGLFGESIDKDQFHDSTQYDDQDRMMDEEI